MPTNEFAFFQALIDIVGSEYLSAKSIGWRVSSNDIFLDKDYRKYGFSHQLDSMFSSVLIELQNTGAVGSGSLSHHIDGLIIDHPKYGTRIIEFDEEQHFNPFREATLRQLSDHVELKYLSHYQKMLQGPGLL